MKYILTFLIILTSHVLFSQEVMPEVWAKLASEEKANVLLLFESQLEQSNLIVEGNKFSKNAHVYHQLYRNANHTQRDLRSFLDQNQIDYSAFYIVNMIQLEADASLINQLLKFEELRSIHLNEDVKLEFNYSVPSVDFRATEWGIRNIRADQVWDSIGVRGRGVVVGGQDTGYEWDHPALVEKYRGSNDTGVVHDYNWHDAIDSNHRLNSGPNSCGYQLRSPCDDHNHGTHTMGTMVGDDGTGNQIGVAPEAKWMGCRNMERGWGTMASYIECFEWFVAPYALGQNSSNGEPFFAPHVINNSWGCPPIEGCNSNNFEIMQRVVENVKAAGIVVVVSAGNEGPDCSTVQNPAPIYDASFTVGATDINDDIAEFSSRGPVSVDGSLRPKPNVCAPGVNVRSSIRFDAYSFSNGTSMAGPHVAGAVALMISAVPSLAGQVDTLESILEETARPILATQLCGNDTINQIPNAVYGYGIIDAYAAVKEAQRRFPLQWIKVEGLLENQKHLIRWTTSNEVNSDLFEIEMSADGVLWEKISQVQAKGSRETTQDYEIENDDFFSPKAYYRIKHLDQDGHSIYSPTVLIEVTNSLTSNPMYLIDIYPNPNNGNFYINIPEQLLNQNMQLKVYDALGQLRNEMPLDLSLISINLSSGMYFIKVESKHGVEFVEKMIVN